MTTSSGLKMLTSEPIPAPSMPSDLGEILPGAVVAASGRFDQSSRRRALAEPALRGFIAPPTPPPAPRSARVPCRPRDRDAAAVVDDHVPQLGACPDPAAVRPPVQDQPAADAGSQRQSDDVACASAGSESPLGNRGRIRRRCRAQPAARTARSSGHGSRDPPAGCAPKRRRGPSAGRSLTAIRSRGPRHRP